jgi:hypothetical protein
VENIISVRAMDRNCNIERKPAQIDFAFHRRGKRVVLVSVAGFGGIVFRTLHRRLLLSYAEGNRVAKGRMSWNRES